MISEILAYAGPYRLTNIKTTTTDDGLAWSAQLYLSGKPIGEVEDRGDGGPIQVFVNAQEQQALKTFSEQRTGEDIEPEAVFLAMLASYTERIDKLMAINAATPVIFSPDSAVDVFGVPTKHAIARCANTEQNLRAIRNRYPDHRLLSDEIVLWTASSQGLGEPVPKVERPQT